MSSTFRPSGKQTIVEEGSSFKGTLTSSCPIHVHGRIEGELDTPSLVVSATGAVHGRAKVGEVRSQGELSGEFDADTVELAGTVRDNTVIRAKSLEVKLSSQRGKLQVIFGECELSVGDAPTEHDAVDATTEPEAAVAAAPPEAMPPAEMPAPMPPDAKPAPMMATPEAPAAAETMAAPALEVSDAGADDSMDDADGDSDDEAEAEAGAEIEAEAGAEATGGGRRRRRKRGKQEDTGPNKTGWSHPPSQPPPAN